MNTPIVPDHMFKMWADPRFQMLAEVDRLLNGGKTAKPVTKHCKDVAVLDSNALLIWLLKK